MRYTDDGGEARRRRFEEVYAANRGLILVYAMRRTDSPDDAADVVAETFLTAWRRLDDVPAGEQARLWLYGVARRVLANHQRGQHRRSKLAGRLRSELAATWCEAGHTTGELASLEAAFHRLPGPDQELLALVFWEELDNGQIAAVLGCSRNAVRIRLHRARRRLAGALSPLRSVPLPAPVQVTNGGTP